MESLTTSKDTVTEKHVLASRASVTDSSESSESTTDSAVDANNPQCSHCGSTDVRLIYEQEKPSWREVLAMESPSCPSWYARTQQLKLERLLDSLLGSGCWEYSDDASELWAESAKGNRVEPVNICYQKWFAGMEPSYTWDEASF